jgi:hypothetical protein
MKGKHFWPNGRIHFFFAAADAVRLPRKVQADTLHLHCELWKAQKVCLFSRRYNSLLLLAL